MGDPSPIFPIVSYASLRFPTNPTSAERYPWNREVMRDVVSVGESFMHQNLPFLQSWKWKIILLLQRKLIWTRELFSTEPWQEPYFCLRNHDISNPDTAGYFFGHSKLAKIKALIFPKIGRKYPSSYRSSGKWCVLSIRKRVSSTQSGNTISTKPWNHQRKDVNSMNYWSCSSLNYHHRLAIIPLSCLLVT